MKIAFISYWSCPLERLGVLNAGGMNVYVYNLAVHLGKLGHQIDIFTRTHNTKEQKVLELSPNVRLIHLPSAFKDPYLDIKPYADKLSKYIQYYHLHYDILHAHYFHSASIAKVLSRQLRIPALVTFHTTAAVKYAYGGIKDVKREKVEKEIIANTQGIIVSTNLEKKDLVKYYQADPHKIFILNPGVDHLLFKHHDREKARIKLKLPLTKKIILFVGRIDPIKGITLLIEAIDNLTKLYPSFMNKFRVLLIGGDIKNRIFWHLSEVKKISEMISTKNIDCCVKFIGSKPHHILPFYYCASDIVVMPSAYESFGLVVLEAMACQSAVIASKVGGLKYLIKDNKNGRLFKNGDKEDLGKIIWEVVNNPSQQKKIGAAAYATSQKYCWSKQAGKAIKIYAQHL